MADDENDHARDRELGAGFPARLSPTELCFDDLILPHATLGQLSELRSWLTHREALDRDPRKRGFAAVFHGPPGTGKTLAAMVLGKLCERAVFHVDLRSVVSKYIGETEKNLDLVFELAKQHDGILFFDEAEALFGERTTVTDAHDRFADLQVGYLLQRIEAFEGVSILATHPGINIDEAFLRRFRAVIHFPMPASAERLRLWRRALLPMCQLEEGVRLEELAEKHELAGGAIVSVVRAAALLASTRDSPEIRAADLEDGIHAELLRAGRPTNLRDFSVPGRN